MFSRRTLFLCSIVSVVAAVLAGCSDSYGGRMAVSGAVKLAGQPLKDGSITFVPLDKQDTQSGAPVVQGEYTIPRQSGLKPGKYLVQITSGDAKTPDTSEEFVAPGPGGSTNIVSVDMVPEEWNTRSKKQVEVKSSGANKFDFDIPHINPRAKRR
jgi:hypothetical protein